MKVKELIEQLRQADPESEVILQKDAEGNGYSPLYDVDKEAVYIPESTWGGEVIFIEWGAEGALMDEDEWADLLKQPRCVVLGPVN